MDIKEPFWHPSASSGFLLDWDGVIAETKLKFEEIRKRYYGDNADAMLLEDAHTLPARERKNLMKDLRDLEVAGAEKAVPVDGAFDLLDWLSGNKRPFCIISRNCADSIKTAAKAIGFKLPEMTFCRDNARFIKPDPRALKDAALALGFAPSRCSCVGDFIYDMQGARRAGMRAVLVQRTGDGWSDWCDVFYPKVTEMVASLKSPEPLVPWEYRWIHTKRGDKWLNAAREAVLELPENTSPTLDCWLARAAALGVGAISIPDDMFFSPSDWKNSPSFDMSAMGRKVADIAKAYLAPRFPMIRVTSEPGLHAPKNSLDLIRFVERKIYSK